MPDITLVIVNYFSSELTRRAVSSARATTGRSLDVVVVDNSCDESERKALEDSGADQLIISPDNLGYAGGANRGAAVSEAPVVVVSNPDVIYEDGCLDRLAAHLSGDVAVAGPRIHWDASGRWQLPPADLLGGWDKLDQALASRFAIAARRRNRARSRRRIDFWRRSSPGPIDAVSGAVMAVSRKWFDAVGGFDTRYELYFEEIDLVRRLGARGGVTMYVPEARCRHLYNQSAGSAPESSDKFLRSETAYLKRWARFLQPLVTSMAGSVRPPAEGGFARLEPTATIPLPRGRNEWLVEASPLFTFDTAAGCFASGDAIEFPEEIWLTYRSAALYLRVVDPAALDVAATYVMRK